uniref:Aminotransferase-like plant mobile domain-containing protein n=1 Tax=Quercus lobata TaxID=97700 RepID=A0A7N2MYQ3_QUELO
MAAVPVQIPDEFGPGPIEGSVLRFLKDHRSCAVWEGKDPGALKCHSRNDELRKRCPIVVDDRVLDIVKRVGLEGLYRTPCREIDHNLITAFVERWRPETHTFHLPYGETMITLQDVEVLLGIPIDGEAIVGKTELTWAAECQSLLGIATNTVVLKGQRILINKLIEKIDQGLPDGAAKMLTNLRNPPQYSWWSACLTWLYRELCRATDRGASQIGGALLLVQYWAWFRFPFLCPRKDLPPDDAYGPPFAPSPLFKTVWVVSTKNSPQEICLVVWQPYETELAHLPAFCVVGRDVWTAKVPLVCFWLVEKHTLDRVLRQFGMVQEIPPYVDTDDTLHDIDLRGKIAGDLEVRRPHFRVTSYYVERLHRITAQLSLEETDGADQEAPEGTGRPTTSSTRASHSHGQRAAPHQVVSRLGPPPPPHAFPAPEIPPRTAHAVPDLEIPLPTAHVSFHPKIPSHTPHTLFDPAHLSFTPPSFDLGYDFSQTPPVMHTQSPSYSICHIDHVPPHSQSMSFMPTPGLHTDPMTTGRTYISSATPSSPAVVGSSVVGSQAKQQDVHVENEQVVGLQSLPQSRPKRTTKAPPSETGGHKAGHKAGPTIESALPSLARPIMSLDANEDAVVGALKQSLDDILPKLMTSIGSYEDLFRKEISKYDRISEDIAHNIEAQEQLLLNPESNEWLKVFHLDHVALACQLLLASAIN